MSYYYMFLVAREKTNRRTAQGTPYV